MNRRRAITLPMLTGCLLLIFWELGSRLAGLSPFVLPPPTAVAAALATSPGLFAFHAGVTVTGLLLGLVAGIATGLGLALLLHRHAPLREALYPWLAASQMIPIPAIAPLLVLMLGFGLGPRVAVVALIVFFPICVNGLTGLRGVDRRQVAVLRTLGAGPGAILRHAELPSALPHLFAGLRVAIALSIVAILFGEWVGAESGLGVLMLHQGNRLRYDGVFAAITVLAAIGLLLFGAIRLIERRCLPWRRLGSAAQTRPE
jgi:ABC-type nitrate/sulfonate/bicarbonate transport system permease component